MFVSIWQEEQQQKNVNEKRLQNTHESLGQQMNESQAKNDHFYMIIKIDKICTKIYNLVQSKSKLKKEKLKNGLGIQSIL